ncbi:hypothetical protein B2K_30285 [Paenibacillus mucilaginosus K02]|uniref:Uncharacterized protein n=1 Tax=Paenibacillus mucilaginosus K02 TaxID=997761 RepID=I0BRE6_9BACL|nr:hypothetical protein B2K_30285 [Paenibacillus mucilaginosus K02]
MIRAWEKEAGGKKSMRSKRIGMMACAVILCAALLYAVGIGRDFKLPPGVYGLGRENGIWLAGPPDAISREELLELPRLPKALEGVIVGLEALYPAAPGRNSFQYELTVLKQGIVLQAVQSYGEPLIHDRVVLAYIRNGKILQKENLEYHWGKGKNITAAGDWVLMHDGRVLAVWDDKTGEPAARIELGAAEQNGSPQTPAAEQQDGQAEQTGTQQASAPQDGQSAQTSTQQASAPQDGQLGQTGTQQASAPQDAQAEQPGAQQSPASQADASWGTPFYVEGYPKEELVILRHARSDTMQVLAAGKLYTPYRDLFGERCRRSIESRSAIVAGVPTGDGLKLAAFEEGVLWLQVQPGPYCEEEVSGQQKVPYPLAWTGE